MALSHHETTSTSGLVTLSIYVTLLFPSFITNLIIVGDWFLFLQWQISHLALSNIIHQILLTIDQKNQRMISIEFSNWFMVGCVVGTYACIFAIFEKS